VRFLLSQSLTDAKGPGGVAWGAGFPSGQARSKVNLDEPGLQPMRKFDPRFPKLWFEIAAIQNRQYFEALS
jgi:hypothetical protein